MNEPDTSQSGKDVRNLVSYLKEGNAHVSLREAIDGVPGDERAEVPDLLPYSVWDLLEHIRIAQWDIVEFCQAPDHETPPFPEGFWPENTRGVSDREWEESIRAVKKDRDRLIDLLRNPDRPPDEPFPWGDGQTLRKEALVVIDHRSYHTGQIVAVRRQLGNWNREEGFHLSRSASE